MSREQVARTVFGATGLVVLVGLVVQLVVVVDSEGGYFTSLPGRVFNMFCFFTVQSNLIVCVTTLLLAVRLDRTSTAFAAFRLAGLIGITITGIVFHLALKDLQELDGSAALADVLLHTASPVLCVLGWLLLGPRGLVSRRVVGLALLFPVLWLTFTLVRGPIVGGFYPYPFLEVDRLGYARVLANVVVVAVLFFLVSAGAALLDRRLPGIRERPPAHAEGRSVEPGTPRGT